MPISSPLEGSAPVDVDHRTMRPPFLRLVRPLGIGGTSLWDFRLGQPNVTHLELDVMHSLEHCLNAWFTEHTPEVVYQVAPLGCQTGLYLVCEGTCEFSDVSQALLKALRGTLTLDSVPMANELDCGWARMHNLAGVQSVATFVLSRAGELVDVDR
jgi:S-ribosylhomocysteine lyase